MKEFLKKMIAKTGYRIIKEKDLTDEFSMFQSLERCEKKGIKINSVIDIGASDGQWSKECMKYYPLAKYLLIEAQSTHGKDLKIFKEKNFNVEYFLGAAGDISGELYFDISSPFGGLASHEEIEGCKKQEKVPVERPDDLIKKYDLKGPYLLKLDTHGFEIPILLGSENILKESNLVIIESYNYKLTNTSVRFYEMCDYMDKKGFYPIEITDFTLRPYDKSLWQMDIFFARKDRMEYGYNSYK